MAFIDKFIHVRQIPGLGIILVLACLYLLGAIVSNFIGRHLFKFIEGVSARIPLVNTIYGIGKQLSHSLSARFPIGVR